MKKYKRMKRRHLKPVLRSLLAILLVVMMVLQGTEPIVALARETIQNMPRYVDFSRPDAVKSLAEVGIEVDDPLLDEPVESPVDAAVGVSASESPAAAESETAETIERETEAIPLREPEDYYPLPDPVDGELVEYTDESKTYKLADGTYHTEIGGYMGIYEAADGELKEVDNTLVEVRDISAEDAFTNKENDYAIQLPKNITEQAGIRLEKDGAVLEIIPLSGDYSKPVAKDNAVLYNQVRPGVDVQYSILDNNIKEDIVLSEPVDNTVFEYELRTDLKAEEKDGLIYLYANQSGQTFEDAIYILEAPAMMDAAENVSTHIQLTLDETEGRYILTVTPDAEWLNAAERQYPVRIDPTAVNITRECFSMYGVEQGSPNIYINDNGYPYVGYDDGIKTGNLIAFGEMHMNCRTYIKVDYDFSTIPTDSKIDSATFSVSQKSTYSSGQTQFGLYRVDDAWSLPISWLAQPSNHTFIDQQQAATSADTYVNFDVKELVNAWIQGTYANNGLVLKAVIEANDAAAAMQCEILNSKNSPYGPKLTLNWSAATDPFLKDMPLDDTTINLRPLTEKALSGKLTVDGVFADGMAKSEAEVEYVLCPDEEAENQHHITGALPEYAFPDSTEFNQIFTAANIYKSKDSNWQTGLYSGLNKDILYQIKAKASKDGETGKEAASEPFVIYEVKQFDTLPKIAKYYGTALTDLMKDNQVQDALVIAGNTIFIRNPQTNVPYSPGTLTDLEKMMIDGALMGRGLHCEFGFEPVNLNTGNFYMDEADVSITDLGGTFELVRSYNSKAGYMNSMFGRGWSFTYDQSLSMLENGDILYSRGDGSFLCFTKQADGSYQAPAGYTYTLAEAAYEGTDHDFIGWEITDAAKTVWSFDHYGMLRYATTLKGYQTALNYDEAYNLTSITSPSGKVFGISQNNQGYITGISLPDGSSITYDYDESGHLLSRTDGNGGVREYHYDDQNQMTSWVDENDHTVITNEYDDEGRVTRQTDANGAVATLSYEAGQTITVDNEGNTTTYSYDDQFRTTQIVYPDGSTCTNSYNDQNQLASTTTANGTKSYTYDAEGNLLSETREDGAIISYTYNAQNLPTSVTDYNGATTTMRYDDSGNLLESILADGSKITYGYDSQHRMISMTDGRGVTTTYSYDGAVLTSYIDGEGSTWSFGYDAMNRPTSVTDPLGNISSTTYDARGNVLSETAANGGTTSYVLDHIGNILSMTDPRGKTSSFTYDAMSNLLTGTDAEGNSISYAYNKNYQVTQTTDAAGHTISHAYDAMGQLVKEVNDDFGTKRNVYDAAGNLIKTTDGNGNVTKAEYNVIGQVTKTIDANNYVTEYTYDANGRETQVGYPDGGTFSRTWDAMGRVTSETDELGAVYSYLYDANGNLLSVTDDSGRTTSSTYDKNNRCVSVTNPDGSVSSYVYDAAGRQISMTDAKGHTQTYTYDGAGRLLSATDALGQIESIGYDANGNIKTTTDKNGNVRSFTYDGLNALSSVTDPLGSITAIKYDRLGNISETIDALKGTTVYSYDSMGHTTGITDALGNTYTYEYDKNGNNTVIYLPTGETVTMAYNALDQMIRCTDAAGLTVEYEYDAMGRLTKTWDNAGNVTGFTYDKAGNVTTQTDTIGRTIAYTYDTYGRLTQIKEADGSINSYTWNALDQLVSSTDAEGHTTTYAYDKPGNLITMTEADAAAYTYAYDQLNRVTAMTDPLGAVTAYQYDANDNLKTLTDANGMVTEWTYDANDNLTAQTDGNGNTSTYEYDELNRLIKEVSPLDEAQEYRYDALNNLTKYKDAMGYITEYQYDTYSNMIKAISPKGEKTAYTYDLHGNVLSVKDPKGSLTSYSVNLNDQVTQVTLPNEGTYSYDYDEAGRLKSMTSPLGYQVILAYDLADNVIEESDSLDRRTTYTYDRLHQMTGSVDALGGIHSFSYDLRGNLTSETDALGRTSGYTYDLGSRMTEAIDPLGQVTALIYDPVGNIEKITKPGGATTTYSYDGIYQVTGVTDPLGNLTALGYDANGRVTALTDALGQQETYTYNANGWLLSQKDKAGFEAVYTYDPHGNILTSTDKTGYKTNYEYDANDNLTKVMDPSGGETIYGYNSMDQMIKYTNALDKTTEYTYDLEGNLTSIKDPAGRIESFIYDTAGRLTAYTSPGGNQRSYNYDQLNQLVKKSYSDAQGTSTDDAVLYAYDSSGQRISMVDTTGTSTYEYDALGRLTSVSDGNGHTIGYAYSESGNLKEMTYADGTKVSYEYDLNDNLTRVTDRSGQVTEYRYDALNRLVETIRPNDTKTFVTYDAMDHIVLLENRCSTCDEVISSYAYTYNEQGYIIKENAVEALAGYAYDDQHDGKHTDGKHDSLTPHGNNHDGKHDKDAENSVRMVAAESSYTYDANGQLISCTLTHEYEGTTVYSYAYDQNGNRTASKTMVNGTATESAAYVYNDANQLILKTDLLVKKNGKTTYTYDVDGNLISSSNGDKSASLTYTYTAENRLRCVTGDKEVLMAATYDGDGNRVFQLNYVTDGNQTNKDNVLIPQSRKTTEGDSALEELVALLPKNSKDRDYTITAYVNDVNQMYTQAVMTYKTDGTVDTAYTYGTERLGSDRNGESLYYLYDGQGSVAGLTDTAGNVVSSYCYDPYGNLTFGTPTGINYYGYNSESTDTNTELQYLRARYYSPANGNFISEDTYLGTTTEPLSRNRYAYVANNPLNYRDPSGHVAAKGAALTAVGATKIPAATVGKVVSGSKAITSSVTNVGKNLVNSVKTTTTKTTNAAAAINLGKSSTNNVGTSTALSKISSAKNLSQFNSPVAKVAEDIRKRIARQFCSENQQKADSDGSKEPETYAAGIITLPPDQTGWLLGGGAAGSVLSGLGALGSFLGIAVWAQVVLEMAFPGISQVQEPLKAGSIPLADAGFAVGKLGNLQFPLRQSDDIETIIGMAGVSASIMTMLAEGASEADGEEVNSDGLPVNDKIKGWTKHGTEQALERDGGAGVSNDAINDAVENPEDVVEQPGGTTKYVGKDATVVLNQDGKVVTTWANGSSGTRGGK